MKKYIFIFLAALVLTSCKKFLDVQPETEISKDELFRTEEGFQEALNGVYTRCVQGDVYGNELTFGLLEVLAQNYTITGQMDPMNYLQTSQYNYRHDNFIRKRDDIWKGLYNAIVNANLILSEIDGKREIFSGNHFELIKGEALALRGYLHFDLFRMFGSAPIAGSVGIPYVKEYSNKVTPMSTGEQVMTQVLADLNEAKELLRGVDSIVRPTYLVNYPNATDSSTETESRSLFQQNRRHRLNYYAVCGALARAYLYKNDKVNALLNAEEVILSKKFPWTKEEDFLYVDDRLVDRILYKELVFAWPIKERVNDVANRFNYNTASFALDRDAAEAMYELTGVGAEDLRFKKWFQLTGSADVMSIIKYRRNTDAREDDNTADRHPLMAPALRLSEMYYIAAEAVYETDPVKAAGYFNEVRIHRGISTSLQVNSYTEFVNELVKEARKELYAESQLFYMYKRLNRPIVGQVGNQIAPSQAIFVFPLPNDEIEFGGR